MSAATSGARQALVTADSDGAALDDLTHALIKGKAPFDGENDGAWQFMVCFNKDACGVCKTCSQRLGTVPAKPFSVCYPGKYGRRSSCCCRHLHEAGEQLSLVI